MESIGPTPRPNIFIVGNSRSGTTMLMRIFERHSEVHTINESHFFEKYWKRGAEDKPLNLVETAQLLQSLVSKQRDGFFAKTNPNYYQECLDIVMSSGETRLSRMDVFQLFLNSETKRAGKTIACEKTPQHIFYLAEILETFPEARIIHMIRDPRAVMASQKNKWRRRFLGSHFIPIEEVLRLRINYHPITICQLWKAAVSAAQPYEDHDQVLTVRYEDLLNNPEAMVKGICDFVGIDFEKDLLEVPVASSSVQPDNPDKTGIHNHSVESWKRHLTANEINIAQKWCKSLMRYWGYDSVSGPFLTYHFFLSLLSYPWKIGLALLINVSRLSNPVGAISRRFSTMKLQKR